MDDHALIRAVAAGDREALGELYERHAELVFRVAYRFLFDEEEARDITQSVFVAVMQSAHRYRPEAKLTTWIYRITANRCLDHRARAGRRAPGEPGDLGRLESEPAPERERPDRLAERAEQQALVREALLRLPERQRVALVLRTYEDLGYAEIAAALECSKSSVESLLFRARRALEALLGR